jgi:putative transposase
MKKSKFTETQIVKAIKEHENGRNVNELCRELGVSTASFYKWRQRYGGMEVKELIKLKELEEENDRLKKMYVNLSLVHETFKEAVEKKL